MSLLYLLLYVLDLGDKCRHIVYIEIPGNSAEVTNEFVKDVARRLNLNLQYLRRENCNYWDAVREHGFPYIRKSRSRWCMWKFKIEVLRNKLISPLRRGDNKVLLVTGLRKSESTYRMRHICLEHYDPYVGAYILNPLVVLPHESPLSRSFHSLARSPSRSTTDSASFRGLPNTSTRSLSNLSRTLGVDTAMGTPS